MQRSDTVEGPPWTILKILKWTTDYFSRSDIESPRASAEVLLAHALGLRRIDLYLHFDQPLNEEELAPFRGMIKRRSKGEPVAYILGHKEFWSLDFKVNQEVLIPRPETECLVEEAVQCLRDAKQGSFPNVLELGTGSGAISIAMAHDYPEANYFASDLSVAGICLARENAFLHLAKSKIAFFAGRWFDAVKKPASGFDLILSNPPYIRDEDIDLLAREIRDYEPRQALGGGRDGLRDIRQIIDQAPSFLKSGGWLIIEIGYDQRIPVESMVDERGAYASIAIKKDYGGQDRVAVLKAN